MSSKPHAVALEAEVEDATPARVALRFADLGPTHELPAVEHARVTTRGEREDPVDGLPEERLRDLANASEGGSSVWFRFTDGSDAYLNPALPPGTELQVRLQTGDERPASAAASSLVGFLESLRETFDVRSARVFWEGPGALCLPEVPLVLDRSVAVLVDDAEIEEHYEDPAVVRKAFDEVRTRDGQWLLLRGMSSNTGPELLRSVMARHWSLARTAKPGETGYGFVELEADEEAIFSAGEPRLRLAGYDRDTARLEFTCVLEPNEHVRPWEVYRLLDVVEEEQTADGDPVEEVRVIFLDREAAEREKRPLLDIGATVAFLDNDGEFVGVES